MTLYWEVKEQRFQKTEKRNPCHSNRMKTPRLILHASKITFPRKYFYMTSFMSISQAPVNRPHTVTRCLIHGNKQSSPSSWAFLGLRDLTELPVSCRGREETGQRETTLNHGHNQSNLKSG